MNGQLPLRLDVLEDLEESLAKTKICLPIPGCEEVEKLRKRLLLELQARFLPEAKKETTVKVVVFSGTSGSGTSSVFNTFLGEETSKVGVVRPTTKKIQAVAHPDTKEAITNYPLANNWDITFLSSVPAGYLFLDVPDLLQSENKQNVKIDNQTQPYSVMDVLAPEKITVASEILEQLLHLSEAWIFVTSAARYGDARSWEYIKRALLLHVPTFIVVNRVPKEAKKEISRDVEKRLGRALKEIYNGNEHNKCSSSAEIIIIEQTQNGKISTEISQRLQNWLFGEGNNKQRSIIVNVGTQTNIASNTDSYKKVKRKNQAKLLSDEIYTVSSFIDQQNNTIASLYELILPSVAVSIFDLQKHLNAANSDYGSPRTCWLGLTCKGGAWELLSKNRWSLTILKKLPASYCRIFMKEIESVLIPLLILCAKTAFQDYLEQWKSLGIFISDSQLKGLDLRSREIQLANEILGSWKKSVKQNIGENLEQLSVYSRQDFNLDSEKKQTILEILETICIGHLVGLAGVTAGMKQLFSENFVHSLQSEVLETSKSVIKENLFQFTDDFLRACGYHARSSGTASLRLRVLELLHHNE